jgi:hypothetical protein
MGSGSFSRGSHAVLASAITLALTNTHAAARIVRPSRIDPIDPIAAMRAFLSSNGAVVADERAHVRTSLGSSASVACAWLSGKPLEAAPAAIVASRRHA